jgi:hypothetical protein
MTLLAKLEDKFGRLFPGRGPKTLLLCRVVLSHGNLAGLYDGVRYCAERNLPLPEWLATATLKLIRTYAQAAQTGKPGRHARWETQYREDGEHLRRWLAVERERRSGASREDALARAAENLGEPEQTVIDSYKIIQKVRRLTPGRLYRAQK